MAWSDSHNAVILGNVDCFFSDNWYGLIDHWNDYFMSDELFVSLVFWVDRKSYIAKNCFWIVGSYNQSDVFGIDKISDIIYLSFYFFPNNFFWRNVCLSLVGSVVDSHVIFNPSLLHIVIDCVS
jgi:hypothetical protein